MPVDTTLNTFIRSHARLTGTKFMCLEGGCGVCVVHISGRHPVTHEKRSFAVNSCLWFVYACHGLSVTTIEGIGDRQRGYHPIQNALCHFNGSQCGYCSPGMVMNMYSLLEANHGRVTMNDVENSFGGNICRCTGYRPILDAFKSFASDSCAADIEDLTNDFCKLKQKCQNAQNVFEIDLKKSLSIRFDDDSVWYKATNLKETLGFISEKTDGKNYMLVGGDTAHGL